MKRLVIRSLLVLGLGIGVVALFALPGEARKKIVEDKADRRFDHDAHAKMVKDKGIKAAKCGDNCHGVTAAGVFVKTGKREHARCFEGCHGGFKHQYTTSKSTLRGAVGRPCYSCHGTKLKYRPSSVGKVNQSTGTKFATWYSHKKHTKPGQATGRQCEQCHGSFGSGSPKKTNLLAGGHSVCSNCHEKGMDPLMNVCDGCHIDRSSDKGKTPVMRPRGPNKYATTGAFDHDNHARQNRVGTAGKDCLACHSNITEAEDDAQIPLPSMLGCYESCHNGKEAFDATGATCTRCHQGGRK